MKWHVLEVFSSEVEMLAWGNVPNRTGRLQRQPKAAWVILLLNFTHIIRKKYSLYVLHMIKSFLSIFESAVFITKCRF